MPEQHHKQIPIQVWVDIDEGITPLITYLNTLPGVRTHASCQGTIGEGGPNPYRPQVMVTWSTPEAFRRLREEFDFSIPGEPEWTDAYTWAYVHPRDGWKPPDHVNIFAAIAAQADRDYITPEDVNAALKVHPADVVRRDVLQVLGKQAGLGAEDPGLCAFVAWTGVYEPEVEEEESGNGDD